MSKPLTLNDSVSAEIRVALARHQISQNQLAMALGVTPMYHSRRFRSDCEWTVEEVARIAAFLRMPVLELVPVLADTATGAQAPCPS